MKECEVYGMMKGLRTFFMVKSVFIPKNGLELSLFLVKMEIDIKVYGCIQ